MNIPEIYLIEPYNAYAPKGRKKHWHEIIEEQALMARIIAEQQAKQQQALQEAQSKTLPPQAPPISVATVVGSSAGSGIGGKAGSGAGGGGLPVYAFFNPTSFGIDFSGTPRNGDAPLTVKFTNLTGDEEVDTFTWHFGDGNTSTDEDPTHLYQSGSAAGFDVQLTASYPIGSWSGSFKTAYISASIPSVTAKFTFTTSSNVGPETATFTNGSSTTSQTAPALIYLWTFGDTNTSTSTNPVHLYDTSSIGGKGLGTGSFTASLQTTGSYNIASKYTQSFYIFAPTLTTIFTFTTSSNVGPETATFTNASTYNGHGITSSLWTFGDGNTSTLTSPLAHTYANTGSFTASLQITESSYSGSAFYTRSFYIPAPTLTAAFTFITESNTAPSSASFTNTTMYDGSGTKTNVTWSYGSGSLTSNAYDAPALTYTTASTYTVILSVTESSYNIKSSAAHSFTLV
jgi:PKD repeat protein